MSTHMLHFDGTGRTHEDFVVPQGKEVYLVRAKANQGTATVTDHLSRENYEIPNGQTVYKTNIKPGTHVALSFIARSNNKISFVNAELR